MRRQQGERIAVAVGVDLRRKLAVQQTGYHAAGNRHRTNQLEYYDELDDNPCPHLDDEQGWELWIARERSRTTGRPE